MIVTSRRREPAAARIQHHLPPYHKSTTNVTFGCRKCIEEAHATCYFDTEMSRAGRPSKSDDSSCLTKNAIAARENRRKRKDYVKSLEEQAKKLDEEINFLRHKNAEDHRKTEEMNRQISSLKGTLSKISDHYHSKRESSSKSYTDHCY